MDKDNLVKLKLNPYAAVIGGVIAVSFSPLLTKVSLNNGTSPVIIAFYRLLFTAVILLPAALGTKKGRHEFQSISKKDFFMAAMSGLALAFHFVSWFTSLIYTSTFASTVLVAMQPIFIVIFGFFLLKERIKVHSWLAVLLALLGTVLIGWADKGSGENSLWGDFLALLGAFFVACYFMLGRVLRQRMSLFTYSFTVYGVCAAILGLWAVLFQIPLMPYQAEDYLAFLGLAVICTIFGHTAFNWAVKYLKTSIVSMSILGEPVGAALWAYLLMAEVPVFSVLLGGIVVMMGVGLFNYWENHDINIPQKSVIKNS